MGETLKSENLGSYIRGLERRVLALETSRRPSQTFVDVVPADPVGTFDTDYVTLFRIRLDVLVAPVLEVGLVAFTDGGSQGVWRLQANNIAGLPVSAEVPFAGAAASYTTELSFGQGAVGGLGFIGTSVNVQAKRTSGGSGVYLFYPSVAMLDYGLTTTDVS
jgi:hypothetical protein